MTETSAIDMDLKKAFQELQEKVMETRQKIRIADIQIEGQKQVIRRSDLTMQELETLVDTTPVYEAVGRMFLRQTMSNCLSDLHERSEKSKEKIQSCENNKSYLEKSLKESEDNLRELITAKKAGR